MTIFFEDDFDSWDEVVPELDFESFFQGFLYELEVEDDFVAEYLLVSFVHFMFWKVFEESSQHDKFVLTWFF